MDQEELRFIVHQYDNNIVLNNSFQENQQLVLQMKKEVFLYFLKEWEEFQKNVKPNCISDLASKKSEQRDDFSMFSGAGGYLMLYQRIYGFIKAINNDDFYIGEARKVLSDEQLMKFFDPKFHLQNSSTCFVNIEQFISNKQDQNISFFFSQQAIWLRGCILYYYKDDEDRFELYYKKLISYTDTILKSPDKQYYELLYGVPGYLYSLLYFQKFFGDTNVSQGYRRDVRQQIYDLSFLIIDKGFQNYDPMKPLSQYLAGKYLGYGQNFRLCFTFAGKEYIGGAHGLFGILQILLICYKEHKSFIQQKNEKFSVVMFESIRASLKTLCHLQLPSGNFPPSIAKKDSDYLQQFCHGAPGAIAPLVRSWEIYEENELLDAACQAANSVWKQGLLKKGGGLCHGISGNAYGFLKLYKAKKDIKYLQYAYKFLTFKNDQQAYQVIKNYDFSDRFRVGFSDNPFSLMLGSVGDMIAQLDFLEENENGFPGYEI